MCPLTAVAARFAAFALTLLLAACGGPQVADSPVEQPTLPGYEAVQDGAFFIPAVERKVLFGDQSRAQVAYAGSEDPGSIVIDTFARKLYFIEEGGMAMRYAIAVGREGLSFRGSGVIGRKQEWPSWTPTANMVRTRPDLYAAYAGGLPGGLENPLGARAMYLYRNGRDSYFRIHGTTDNASIGHATSAGCIRLFNQDAIYLYDRVEMGAQVKVRSLEESLALEGPYMDDAYGYAVPATPENRAQQETDLIRLAEQNIFQPDAEAAIEAAASAAGAELAAGDG